MRAVLLPLLLLAACASPSRDAVEQAGALRRDPAAIASMADRPLDCGVRDRACATLWLARGAACARQGREDCAIDAFHQAASLTPDDAPVAERVEAPLRLADALERRRDRVMGEARRAANAAILAAVAALPASPGGAGPAAHFRAGVGLNRILAGDVPPARRCAALAAVTAEMRAAASDLLADRIAQRHAALDAARAAQTPECR